MRSLTMTAVAGALLTVLAGCSSTPEKPRDEDFAMSDTYTRSYEVPPEAVCSAGRRALLSQGYNIDRAEPSRIAGHKNFQREEGQHTQIKFSMECASDGAEGGATAFASALEDRYSIKTVSNSASVGLSVLGSVSMPTGSSPDSLVKTASETIARPAFYSGFFDLLERYLPSPEEARAAAAAKPAPAQANPASTTRNVAPASNAVSPPPAANVTAPDGAAPAPTSDAPVAPSAEVPPPPTSGTGPSTPAAPSAIEAATPASDTAAPSSPGAAPSGNPAAPGTAAPSDPGTTAPVNEFTSPESGATAPESGAVPADAATPPEGSTAVPAPGTM